MGDNHEPSVEEQVAIAQLEGWSRLGDCVCGAAVLSDGATNICTRTGDEAEACDWEVNEDG